MAASQPRSDVGMIWKQALDDYEKTTGLDMRQHVHSHTDIKSIMADHQRWLAEFEDFRHPKGKLDRVRTALSSNVDLIQNVTLTVASGICVVCPPASAVVTAFTFVITASKQVSSDYDIIEGFFKIMQAFLERLLFMERMIPSQEAIQRPLMEVFSSLLDLSGIASAYCAKGRLSKGVKDLIHGGDRKLSEAYSNLNSALSQLESAVIMQIWRSTVDISAQTKSTDGLLVSLKGLQERNNDMTKESYLMLSHHVQEARDSRTVQTKQLDDIAKSIEQMRADDGKSKERVNDIKSKDRIMSSGANKPVVFERLKRDFLANDAESAVTSRLLEIKKAHVPGVFDWICEEPSFQSIANASTTFLWVSGASCMGKSTVSVVMLNYLDRMFSLDSTVSVTWFSFDEERSEMRSIENMIRCCSIQAAKSDPLYCRDTDEVLRRSEELDTDRSAWEMLIESRYSKEHSRRLILVLDGIDELTKEDLDKLVGLLGQIRSQDCKIQVIFTCDPDNEEDVSKLGAERIVLSCQKVARAMREFTLGRLKTLPRLRRLRRDVRRSIVEKMMRKADSFSYIEHTLRRLNAIGRIGYIQKELKCLADSTTAVYQKILADCLESRPPEDRESLRRLFAWLAYTKSSFTVADATSLGRLMNDYRSINIEEELHGRLSGLLRISGDHIEPRKDDTSADEDTSESTAYEDSDSEDESEDQSDFLRFQERSLKKWVRQKMPDHHDGLRYNAAEAHVIIFQLCCAILTASNKTATLAGSGNLEAYAVQYSLDHLQQIPTSVDSGVNAENAAVVVLGIYKIFTNTGGSLKLLEKHTRGARLFLRGGGDPKDAPPDMLSAWAQRALLLGEAHLSDKILAWFRTLAQEPVQIFLRLARVHVEHWFSAESQDDAFFAFRSAHKALYESRDLSELKERPGLSQYFDEFGKDEENFTERSFEVVANFFQDIHKIPSSYRGIALAMKSKGLFQPAIRQLTQGLDHETIDKLDRCKLLGSMCQGLVVLGMEEEDEAKQKQCFENALTMGEQVNAIYRQLEQVNHNGIHAWMLCNNLQNMACAAAFLGQAEHALELFKEALGSKESIDFPIIANLIEAFRDMDRFPLIMQVLRLISKAEATTYLFAAGSFAVQEAAFRTTQGHYLLELYKRAQRIWAIWLSGTDYNTGDNARLQSRAAMFAWHALGDLDQAKKILVGMIQHPRTPDWRIFDGCNRIAGICFEQFRLSKDPWVKKHALDETKGLLRKLEESFPNDFNPKQSHITVTVALMLKRLGPTQEFHKCLDDAFEKCIVELRDDTGANDQSALRRLTRVLSCIPGFAEDARISSTAQFYVIDDDVRRRDLEKNQASIIDTTAAALKEEGDTTKKNSSQSHSEMKQSPSEVVDTPISSDAALTPPSSESVSSATNDATPEDNDEIDADDAKQAAAARDDMKEGLLDDNECINCDICGKVIWGFADGPVYYCVYCLDCDICKDCFDTKLQREKDKVKHWRVVCPEGHRHVKAPVEGWRGVKNGIMRIEEREISFKEWLQGLENKWSKYWVEFWTETDDV